MMELYEKVTVCAPDGAYIGRRDEGVCRFLGVPFGTARRWQRPQRVSTTEKSMNDATVYGASPWQTKDAELPTEPAGFSEECLNLNLFCADMETPGKSVLVWIYGGAQVAGNNRGPRTANGETLFDGRELVRENPDIILVVPNYRLGVWGSVNLSFLPDYSEEYSASNNLARLDILRCLHWIRDNIAAFGGDAEKITLFGQSAGSANITSLLLMPQAKGSFKRVICESSFAMDISLTGFDDSITVSKAIFDELGVSTLKEALALPPEKLLKAQEQLVSCSMGGNSVFSDIESKLFSPVVDGVCIPQKYWTYLQNEGCRGVDFLGGTNSGEYDQQFAAFSGDLHGARELLLSHCGGKLKDRKAEAEKYFTGGEENRTEFEAVKDMKNDLYLRMGAVSYARVFADCGASSWLYYLKGKENIARNAPRCPHGAELPMVFRKPNDAQKALEARIRGAWVSFAKTGDPNAEGANCVWTQFTREKQQTMVLSDRPHIENGVRNSDTELLLPWLREQAAEYEK